MKTRFFMALQWIYLCVNSSALYGMNTTMPLITDTLVESLNNGVRDAQICIFTTSVVAGLGNPVITEHTYGEEDCSALLRTISKRLIRNISYTAVTFLPQLIAYQALAHMDPSHNVMQPAVIYFNPSLGYSLGLMMRVVGSCVRDTCQARRERLRRIEGPIELQENEEAV